MRFTLYIFVFVISYLNAEASGTYRAFVFNRSKATIVKLPSKLLDINCDAWMTSCPAEDDDERKFENEYSLYNKALFVQMVYFAYGKCTDLDKAVCNKPIETSMTFSHHNKKFEFGYETFHEYSKLPEIFHLPFDTYYPVKKFKKEKTILEKLFSKKTRTEMQERKKAMEAGLELRESGMGFNWVPLVKVKLNSEQLQNVEYEIHQNNINPMLECQDYSLGNEIMDSVDVDSLYENQKKIFEKAILSTRKSKTDENPLSSCSSEHQCLTKWPLLPTDQFQFGSDSPLKCSNVTTVPIWRSTLEGIMRKLDQYLYTLYRVNRYVYLQESIKISSCNQVLIGSVKRKYWKNENLKIEIPKIIYKMVKFRLSPCQGKKCWYGILIVIHNDPYFNKKHFVCEDQSRDLGWEEIGYETWSNEGAYSKFIYVCEISKKTMHSVGLANTQNKQVEPLSLLKFPHLDENEELMFRSVKGDVFNELKRLSDPDQKVELDDILIERPAIYYNFGSKNDEDFVYEDDPNSGEGE